MRQRGCKQTLQPSLGMTATPANIFYFYFYIDVRELERERKVDLLFHLFMHALVEFLHVP